MPVGPESDDESTLRVRVGMGLEMAEDRLEEGATRNGHPVTTEERERDDRVVSQDVMVQSEIFKPDLTTDEAHLRLSHPGRTMFGGETSEDGDVLGDRLAGEDKGKRHHAHSGERQEPVSGACEHRLCAETDRSRPEPRHAGEAEQSEAEEQLLKRTLWP